MEAENKKKRENEWTLDFAWGPRKRSRVAIRRYLRTTVTRNAFAAASAPRPGPITRRVSRDAVRAKFGTATRPLTRGRLPRTPPRASHAVTVCRHAGLAGTESNDAVREHRARQRIS